MTTSRGINIPYPDVPGTRGVSPEGEVQFTPSPPPEAPPPEAPPEKETPTTKRVKRQFEVSKVFTREEIEKAGLKDPPRTWEVEDYQRWYYDTPEGRQQILYDVARSRASRGLPIDWTKIPDGYVPDLTPKKRRKIKGVKGGMGISAGEYERITGISPAAGRPQKVKKPEAKTQELEPVGKDKSFEIPLPLGAPISEPSRLALASQGIPDIGKVATQMRDGSWVINESLRKIKESSPRGYEILTTRGYDAYVEWGKIVNQRYMANQAALKALKPYMDGDNVDTSRYLRDHPKGATVLMDAGISDRDIHRAIEFNASIVKWSAETAAQGQAFSNRVREVMIARPQLAQHEAETIVRTEFKAKGIALAPQLTMAKRVELAREYYKNLTPEGKARLVKEAKHLPVELAELAVPGVHTGIHWTELDTQGKIINVGLDVVSVLLMFGIAKIPRGVSRQLTGVNKVRRIAGTAGKTGKQLNDATRTYRLAQRFTPGNVGLLTKHANKVATLQAKSVKADRAFLDALDNLGTISKADLKVLERSAKLRGLTSGVVKVQKAQKALDKAWVDLGELSFYTSARTPRQIMHNNAYIKQLEKIQRLQRQLDDALGYAGSTLQPRYKSPPSPPEFKGYSGTWEKPTIKGDDDVFKSIDNWLARSRETKLTGEEPWQRTATKVLEKPETKGVHDLRLKPQYAKARAQKVPAPRVPKLKPETSVFPGIRPLIQPRTQTKVRAIPAEDINRMTAAQIARYYGAESVVDGMAETIEQRTKRLLGGGAPEVKQGAQVAAMVGFQAYVQALNENLSKAQAINKAEESVKRALSPQYMPATQAATVAKVVVRPLTKTPISRPMLSPKLKPVRVPAVLPYKVGQPSRPKVIPAGSLLWKMGWCWKYIPPPFNQTKPISLGKTPPGGADVSGRTPFETLQVIGHTRARVPRLVAVDLGWADIYIKNGREIAFSAEGEDTDIGTGDPSPTIGMSAFNGVSRPQLRRERRLARGSRVPAELRQIHEEGESMDRPGIEPEYEQEDYEPTPAPQPEPEQEPDDTADLFSVTREDMLGKQDGNSMDDGDYTDLTMLDDEDEGDLLEVSNEDIFGGSPKPKQTRQLTRFRRTQRTYQPPPASLGGMRY